MAPSKKKGGKGKEMSLSEFQGDAAPKGGEFDWAETPWEDEQGHDDGQHHPGYAGTEGVKSEAGAILHAKRYNHDKTKLGTETNFRDASSKVPDDMPPPYVAHLGNLKTGISKEVLCSEFFPDKIKECRLITRDERSTFAFLEFEDVRTLQLVLLMNERMVLGRKVRIDVASHEQIARMNNNNNKEGGFGKRFGGSMGGGGGGGESNAALDSLDRDVFGTGSPVTPGNNRNFGSRSSPASGGGGNALLGREPGAFADFRSGPAVIQHGGGGSMQDLDNWRGSDVLTQPAFQPTTTTDGEGASALRSGNRPRNHRGGGGSPTSGGAPSFIRRGNNNNNDNAMTSPASGGETMGNWRDEPQAKQPELPTPTQPQQQQQQSEVAATTTTAGQQQSTNNNNNNKRRASNENENNNNAGTGGGGSGGGRFGFGEAQQQPRQQQQQRKPAPSSTPTPSPSSSTAAKTATALPPPPASTQAEPAVPPTATVAKSWAAMAAAPKVEPTAPPPTAPQPKSILPRNNNAGGGGNKNKAVPTPSERFDFRK